MIPHIKRVSDKVKPPKTGYSMGCVITLKKGHENEEGLIAHELTHVKQWWRIVALFAACFTGIYFLAPEYFIASTAFTPFGLMAHNVLYRIRAYRKYAEVEAFKEHIKHGRDFENAAYNLHKHYDLDITLEEARKLLRG